MSQASGFGTGTGPGTFVETLTGNTGGPVGPTGGNINVVGDGTTITIAGNPGTSTLTASVVGSIPDSFPTDSGTAVPLAGVLNILGDTHNITTTGAGHTVTVGLTGITQHSLQVGGASNSLTQLGVAINGQLPIGSAGADPVLATLTAGSGVNIVNGAGSITISATGSGGVITTIDGDVGSVTGATVSIEGGGSATTATSGCNFVATSATNLEFEISNINLPANNSNGTVGYITQNNTSGAFLISAPRASGYNIYVGPNAGAAYPYGNVPHPFSGTGVGNAILGGYNTLMQLESFGVPNNASYNNIIGMNSALSLSTGTYNTIINNNPSSPGGITTGSYNIFIGNNTGTTCTGAESSNIYLQNDGVLAESNTMRLGTSGAGNGQVNSTYIAGIDGVNVGSVARVVTEAADKLGTAIITAGTGITVTAGANTITIAATGTTNLTYVSVNHAASPYTALATDEYISADVTAGVVSILLPNAPATGRVFIVKDKVGLAGTSNITVTTVGGAVNIDGATSFVMNTNYESAQFIFNGVSYEVF